MTNKELEDYASSHGMDVESLTTMVGDCIEAMSTDELLALVKKHIDAKTINYETKEFIKKHYIKKYYITLH
jgi:hypothetical protein